MQMFWDDDTNNDTRGMTIPNLVFFSKNREAKISIFRSLPNNKILDTSELKAFADDKIILTQKLKFDLGWVENMVGKGYQHFHVFPQCFQRSSSSSESLKVMIEW